MEEEKKKDCGECTCIAGMCCHRHYMAHHIVRWVLGIIIISFVFWMGVQIGEFKGYYGDYYGGRFGGMMRGGYGWMGSYSDGGSLPMMYYYSSGTARGGASAAPAAPQGTAK